MRLFRQAKDARPAWNLLKTFAQIVIFWGVFLGVLPSVIRTLEAALGFPTLTFAYQGALGVVLFVLFSGLGLWSGVTMSWLGRGTPLPVDGTRDLVTRGPYAYVRNPMAVAGLGQAIAIGIGVGSLSIIMYGLAGGVVWNWLVRPIEEQDLLQRFGTPYGQYRQDVRCWIPRFTFNRKSNYRSQRSAQRPRLILPMGSRAR